MPLSPSPGPPPSSWSFPDPRAADGDIVCIGGDLEPATLFEAYTHGLFPMATDGVMAWWSPVDRGVLPLDGLRVTRSLRQSAKHFEIRVDTAFEDVIDACADPGRSGGWIDQEIRSAYTRMHELGWAHSVEAWRDGELAGGLYGVAIGGLFAGESMFSRQRDASKVALMGLVDLLDDDHAGGRLLDTQWQTEHLETLGVVEIPREEYLARLDGALDLPLPPGFG